MSLEDADSMLTLENFEQVIDSTILQRGRQYYKAGQVVQLDEDDGVWTAVVAGSEDYTVEIERDAHGALLPDCDCPYEYGPYCKHVTAVLYALRDRSKSGVKPDPADKKHRENIRDVVKGLSQDQLVDIVLDVVKKDKLLGNSILLRYAQSAPQKETFIRIIQDVLRTARGRDGYIDYGDTHRASKPIYDLLDEAAHSIEAGQANRALPILQAIVETMPSSLEYADDSNGELSGCIEAVFNAFNDAVKVMNADEKQHFFDYCLEQAFADQYSGLDYDWAFLDTVGELVQSPEQRTVLFDALDRKTASLSRLNHMQFREEHAAQIKLDVMERQGDSPDSIHHFLTDNVHLNAVRQRLIEQSIEEGKLNTARKWCLEAIKKYQAEALHGLVRQYQAYMLQIAQREEDPLAVMDLARDLFLNTQQFEYYDMLKKAVPPAEWPSYLNKLLKKVAEVRHWGGPNHVLAAIYYRERMLPELLALAQQAGVLFLEQYKVTLHAAYPAECCAIYERAVYQMLNSANGRGAYQQAALCLKQMKQLGQAGRVREIIDDLKTKYPRRPAMLEELARV